MKKLTNIDIFSADTHEGLEEKLNMGINGSTRWM